MIYLKKIWLKTDRSDFDFNQSPMNMRNIRIFLQYPWRLPDSSYYKNMLEFPPRNVEFINYNRSSSKKMSIIGSSRKFESMRKLKNLIRKILTMIRMPNLTYTFEKDIDVIHCAHCLSLNKKPWIVDTESYDRVSAFSKISYSRIGKWIIKKSFESQYCKKIICWSEDCKKTFEAAFPNNKTILNKIEILPFALQMPKFKKIPHKNLRILFVARWFEAKGGRQTLEIFDRISKQYPKAEFVFICPTPKEFIEKYSKNKSIKIMGLMPQEKLFEEVYPSCDLFFYPGFGDSYGFAVPEALSYGLPVITSDTFAKRELVKDRKTGFLIDMPKNWKGYNDMNEKMLNNYVDKTLILLKNKKLRNKMAKDAITEAEEKFSIKKRNERLKDIYIRARSNN